MMPKTARGSRPNETGIFNNCTCDGSLIPKVEMSNVAHTNFRLDTPDHLPRSPNGKLLFGTV